MRKIRGKQRTFAEKAYQTTQLDFGYTQSKINDMLNELGINDVRITQEGLDYTVEFIVRMRHGESPRKVRINVPFNSNLGESMKKEKRRKNAIFRVLYYHLKDKFVAVQNGLKEFEEEFLADLVIVANGKEQRLGDILVPKYKEMLKSSKVAVFSIKGAEEK